MIDEKIIVIGLGVIGLPTAYMLAHAGYKVCGVDKDVEKINSLNNGNYPLPSDLQILKMDKALDIIFTKEIPENKNINYIVVCVGVGIDEENNPVFNEFDALVKTIGRCISSGVTVCFETTLPPGTTHYKIRPILETMSGMLCGKDFYLVYAPERVTLERLVYNMENMPRVVGGYSIKCRTKGSVLYSTICKSVNVTDLTTAEITKLTENTYRDVNIAYANEIAAVCDECDVDFLEVRRLVNTLPNIPSDEYINPVRNLHFAGAGVGGYCLPKDPHLLRTIRITGLGNSVIKTARSLNGEVPNYIANKTFQIILKSRRANDGKGYNVLILGASAIRNTGDCRNSPINALVGALASGYFVNEICIYDPYVPEYSADFRDFLKVATVIILVTPHKFFEEVFNEEIMYRLKSERVILNDFNLLKT